MFYKAEAIEEYESGMKDDDVAMLYRINQSLVCSENILLFEFQIYLPKLKRFTELHQYYFCQIFHYCTVYLREDPY